MERGYRTQVGKVSGKGGRFLGRGNGFWEGGNERNPVCKWRLGKIRREGPGTDPLG